MNKFLKKIKKIGDEYSYVMSDGDPIKDLESTCDTGVYILNALLDGSIDGGMPLGRRLTLAGAEGCGKSIIAMQIVKSFLDTYKNSICIHIETEGADVSKICKTVGADESRIHVNRLKTVELMRTRISNFIRQLKEERKTNPEQKMIIVVDSMGNLSTSKEVDDVDSGSDTRDMTRAQLIKGFGRSISLELSLLGIPIIMVSHTYSPMKQYAKEVVSGGSGLLYISDIIAIFTKSMEKDGDKQNGISVNATIRKSRYVKENVSKGSIIIHFDKGIYKYSGLAEKMKELKVFKKVPNSNSIELPDGTIVPSFTTLRKKFKEYANEINMNALADAIRKEFKFGQLQEDDSDFSDIEDDIIEEVIENETEE